MGRVRVFSCGGSLLTLPGRSGLSGATGVWMGREPTSPSKAARVGRVVRGGGSLDGLSGLRGEGCLDGGGAASPPSAIKAVRAVRGEGCLDAEEAQQPCQG